MTDVSRCKELSPNSGHIGPARWDRRDGVLTTFLLAVSPNDYIIALSAVVAVQLMLSRMVKIQRRIAEIIIIDGAPSV